MWDQSHKCHAPTNASDVLRHGHHFQMYTWWLLTSCNRDLQHSRITFHFPACSLGPASFLFHTGGIWHFRNALGKTGRRKGSTRGTGVPMIAQAAGGWWWGAADNALHTPASHFLAASAAQSAEESSFRRRPQPRDGRLAEGQVGDQAVRWAKWLCTRAASLSWFRWMSKAHSFYLLHSMVTHGTKTLHSHRGRAGGPWTWGAPQPSAALPLMARGQQGPKPHLHRSALQEQQANSTQPSGTRHDPTW